MRIGWLRAGVLLCLLPLIFGAGSAGASIRAVSTPLVYDTRGAHVDVNNLDMFMSNYGSFAWDLFSGDSGLIFPKGTTKTAIFAAGIWMGAKVGGSTRVSVAEYSMTYGPGKILTSGEPDDPNLPRYRLYKIKTGDTPDSADYRDWPCEDGAPCLPDGTPQLIGDQTIWSVYNDITRSVNDAATPQGIGLEVQQTTFGFNRTGALGNVIFLKFKIINPPTGHDLTDMFVSIWSDPDLGGAQDDLVGCDTTLSLGYCYNATNNDNLYSSAPPAVGFDFFQGPIVPGDSTDVAIVDGRRIPGYRNLPMTSFNKYINGTDPDSPQSAYNYMQGLEATGEPLINPITGDTTRFFMPGNPVSPGATDWLDSNPSDRRMMLNSGPFNMAPGDTQTVVCALIVGQGKDRLTSITALKFYDPFAQAAFDANFDLPSPPPRPVVRTVPLDNEIVLYWDDISETGYDEPGYAFEGYNIYQGESVAGPWKRIATYDISNDVAIIFDAQFDLETGVVVNKPVQFGGDSGIRRSISITNDAIRGGTLRNARPYFFGVTAYSRYVGESPDQAVGRLTLENATDPIEIVPQVPTAGTRLAGGTAGDTLSVAHTGGRSDATITPIVLDPNALTGDTYEVTFQPDSVGAGASWSVRTTTGRIVLSGQRNVSDDDTHPIVEGIQWKVKAPTGFRLNAKGNPMIDEIRAGGGAVVPPDVNRGPGNDVWHSRNSLTTDVNGDEFGDWLLSAGGGGGGVDRLSNNGADFANFDGRDFIMRWDYDPSDVGWWTFGGDDATGPVPFSIWIKDPVSGDSLRMIPLLYSGGYTQGVYDYPDSGQVADPYSSFPATDWLYAYAPTPGYTYDEFLADYQDNHVIDVDPTDPDGFEVFRRLIVASDAEPPIMPQQGTVIYFTTAKPVTIEDVFRVETRRPVFNETSLKDDLGSIRVVPNPYFAHSQYEMNQFEHVVKFTRMPPYATVRIFNIAGDLVRTLEKTDSRSSILPWDLLTEQRLPVGSGVYIYHVEGKDQAGKVLGSTHGRVAVFIEKERLNTY